MAGACSHSSKSLSALGLDPAAVAALVAVAALAFLPATAGTTSDCMSFSTCRDCIQKPQCRWCTKIEGKAECMNRKDTRTCDGTDYTSKISYDIKNTSPQINPKSAELHLQVGSAYEIEIEFKKKDDYPVDLYYLMDLSNSMRDDKDNLERLGANLSTAMKELTSNFRLGFGSFVDKVAMPFVNTAPVLLQNPCITSNQTCSSPYSYKNHLPLTNDTEKFSSSVRAANISGNIDYPEGGFDALMQAMVCTEKIGWRPDARHLLILATDATFHLAGDGKLAGIVEPNDEQCHLSKEGDYTHYLEYDYPSISQIDRMAREKNINIFFAVTKDVINVYESLEISTASSKVLSDSSDNVVTLVTEQYKKLVETVELEDNAKDVNIQYRTKCQNETGPLQNSSTCKNVNAKKTPVKFYANISVPSCPNDAKDKWETLINIRVKGINESLDLKLQVHCGCPCEQQGNEGYEENSPQCHENGILKCGICECKEGKRGQRCECDTGTQEDEKEDGACIAPNKEVCSGVGHCQCGACTCTPQDGRNFYGKFCECDDHSCSRRNNKICSGEERGECKCKRCVCKAGFTGEACEQSICGPVDKCYESPDGKLCSGFGVCECGKCKCNDNRTGPFCEQCLTCPVIYCSKLKKCVESTVHNVENDGQNPCTIENKNISNFSIVDDIKEEDLKKRQACNFFDDAGCSFLFTYEIKDDIFFIIAEKNKKCPAPLDLLGIIFGVIGATVLLGLLIIVLWKILTTIHDRREYAKFEQERALSKWERGDNPLYIQATSTFSNPTFGN